MSYILDALRRADAERDRGRVPGIHAQVPPPAADDPAPRRGGTSPWRWIVLGAVLGLLVVLAAWLWLGREPAPAPMPPPVATNPPPPIPQPEARPAPLPAPPAAAEPAADLPAPIEQRPTTEAVAAAARKAAGAASRPAATASGPPTTATSAAPAASAQGAGRIYGRHELPEEIRRQLPAVTIGGSIYSPNPANRFVVINGQVVHEGGTIGPDHVLESIRLKSAVLRFRNFRYELLF